MKDKILILFLILWYVANGLAQFPSEVFVEPWPNWETGKVPIFSYDKFPSGFVLNSDDVSNKKLVVETTNGQRFSIPNEYSRFYLIENTLIALSNYSPDYYFSNSVGYFNLSGELLNHNFQFTHPNGGYLVTQDGELYSAGGVFRAGHANEILSIKKLNSEGEFVWEKTFEKELGFPIVRLIYDACLDYLVITCTQFNNDPFSLVYVLDGSGTLLFERKLAMQSKIIAIKNISQETVILIDPQGGCFYRDSLNEDLLDCFEFSAKINRPIYLLANDCTNSLIAIIDWDMKLHFLKSAESEPYLSIDLKMHGLNDRTFVDKFFFNSYSQIVLTSQRLQSTIYVK